VPTHFRSDPVALTFDWYSRRRKRE